eukprot:3022892-Prymnesium_polylepis.1
MAGRGREEGGAKRAFERYDVDGALTERMRGVGCVRRLHTALDPQVGTPSTAHKRHSRVSHTCYVRVPRPRS